MERTAVMKCCWLEKALVSRAVLGECAKNNGSGPLAGILLTLPVDQDEGKISA